MEIVTFVGGSPRTEVGAGTPLAHPGVLSIPNPFQLGESQFFKQIDLVKHSA
jgi:hypothetical protein